jgi:hypothetical protein
MVNGMTDYGLVSLPQSNNTEGMRNVEGEGFDSFEASVIGYHHISFVGSRLDLVFGLACRLFGSRLDLGYGNNKYNMSRLYL